MESPAEMTGPSNRIGAEISLPSKSMCNLSECYVGDITTQTELNKRVADAAYLGTLQATYTDFFYLRPEWKHNVEEDALLGVSLTGIASLPKDNTLDFEEAAEVVRTTNEKLAITLGIKPAKRATCIKPSGTTSLVMGTSSGIHAWYSPYYIRRIRLNKEEALYKYLTSKLPDLVEDEFLRPEDTAVVSIPIEAPKDAVFRDETALETLDRVLKFSNTWIQGGHSEGANRHNVSCTINVKPTEWEGVKGWMWALRHSYTGISLLPYDNGSYVQAPFENIDKETFEKLLPLIKDINLDDIEEFEDNTDLSGELACSGGGCEVT